MDDFAERDTKKIEEKRGSWSSALKEQEAKKVRERERKVLGKEIRVYRHRKNEIEGELEARSVSFGIQNAERSERVNEREREIEKA